MEKCYLDVLEIVKAAGTFVTGVSVLVAAFALWMNWRSAVMQRTLTFLEAYRTENDATRVEMRTEFEPLFGNVRDAKMGSLEADALYLKASLATDDGSAEFKKWQVARRHLNQVERISFAYVHGLVDRKLLCNWSGEYIVRSAKYFHPLIEKFREGRGDTHPWQVIEKAKKRMDKHTY